METMLAARIRWFMAAHVSMSPRPERSLAMARSRSSDHFPPMISRQVRRRYPGSRNLSRDKTAVGDPENRAEINRQFPKRSIHRRNTGYAIDLLSDCAPLTADGPLFNFCRLLAGSEGTLAFLTEITLTREPLPPRESALVCVHCTNIDEALRAIWWRCVTRARLRANGDNILECTKTNFEDSQMLFRAG